MKRSITLATAVALLALAAMAPGAAFAASTLVVDDDGFGTAADCNSATPAYSTIQSAVTAAASGDTIKVCPGSYSEAVTVATSGLILMGPNAGQHARNCPVRANPASVGDGASPAFDLIADDVVLDGFTIHNTSNYGVHTAADHSGYNIRNNVIENNAGGIYLNSDGDSMSRVQFNCIRDNNLLYGSFPTAGTGVYTDQGLTNALIGRNGFQNHLDVAINLAETIAPPTETSNVRVWNNWSKNDRTFLATYGASGIYARGNDIRQNASGHDWDGAAIYIGGGSDVGGDASSSITVTANSITSKNQPHGFYAAIAVRGSAVGVVVSENFIRGTYNGVSITSDASSAAYVLNNLIRNVHNNGIEALVTDPYVGGGPASQNVFAGNRVKGSVNFDCFDDTTGTDFYGVDNSWHHPSNKNFGNTSSPAGLCKPW